MVFLGDYQCSQILATNYIVSSFCATALSGNYFSDGNKVISYQLSPLTLQVNVNSAMPHRTF